MNLRLILASVALVIRLRGIRRGCRVDSRLGPNPG
jgi:hypothetical protein